PRSSQDLARASIPTVGPAYFQALRIPLREGRAFAAEDKLDRPWVVIVNESLARRFWPGQSPLGKRINLDDPANPKWREIVGVVNDVRFPADAAPPETPYQIYRPWAQDDIALGGTVILRTKGGTEATAAALRQALKEL